MTTFGGAGSADDLFADGGLPSLEGGQDAESILVKNMVLSVALPAETLDWLFFASQYCKEDRYGERLAERYVELYARASTGRFKRLTDIVEALSLKKYLPRLPGMPGGPGGGFGGRGGS